MTAGANKNQNPFYINIQAIKRNPLHKDINHQGENQKMDSQSTLLSLLQYTVSNLLMM
jgi:hypothetical protein